MRLPGTTELGAVVVTVSVVAPLPVTVGGIKLQELSEGRPAQEKLVAPLNPFEPVTVSIVVPESPGLVTLIVAGAKEKVKSGCKLTLTVIAGVVDAA